MAGGMILMGGLLLILPVAYAMILHGITQLTANFWRALLWYAHVKWWLVFRYSLGLFAACALFLFVRFVPDQRLVYIFLGVIPFLPLFIPDHHVPRATSTGGAESCGFICTSMQLVSGISGPTLDLFFVNTNVGRRAIVATKAACQVLTHLAKVLYFGAFLTADTSVDLSAAVITVALVCAVLGTSLARPVLERINDVRFRFLTRYIIMSIGFVYLVVGLSGYV
ncbi:sulfite exporter TauE/SafE [Roseinatronobacter bogoriensis DSM 18756]|nr:sulfite exporter TauE/SafE [Rhodobaca bogoriensis DSM 18756]